jgi:hypothetical protein
MGDLESPALTDLATGALFFAEMWYAVLDTKQLVRFEEFEAIIVASVCNILRLGLVTTKAVSIDTSKPHFKVIQNYRTGYVTKLLSEIFLHDKFSQIKAGWTFYLFYQLN